MTHNDLLTAFNDLDEYHLLALDLCRDGSDDPLQLAAATQQMVTYSRACISLASQFANLTSVPILDASLVEEFPL